MALPSLTTHLSLITLVFHLVLPMTLCLAQATAHVEQSGYGNETVLRYYIIEEFGRTVKLVAGIQGEYWSPTTFATIFVVDLRLVEEPSLHSREVGRVEGLVAVASKDGRYDYQSSSTRFTSNEYNGSTLQTKGTFERVSGQPSEIAVVGGTGQLRGARGIGILQIIVQTSNYTITRVTYKFSLPI